MLIIAAYLSGFPNTICQCRCLESWLAPKVVIIRHAPFSSRVIMRRYVSSGQPQYGLDKKGLYDSKPIRYLPLMPYLLRFAAKYRHHSKSLQSYDPSSLCCIYEKFPSERSGAAHPWYFFAPEPLVIAGLIDGLKERSALHTAKKD